ncbi:MAG TPA: hypothetical protein VFB66_07460 [Tepidisphaeraceae bacterium]|nr:hypothetical protein [Tepidisphaeraceae bacterium]
MATAAAEAAKREADMEAFFTGVGAKDRSSIEKHLAAVDAQPHPAHGQLWRRLAVSLRKLAPMPVQTVGQHAVQFYIADGKYRMQVFALEDAKDGRLRIYLPDVSADAVKAGLLSKPVAPAPARRASSVAAGPVGGTTGTDAAAPAADHGREYGVKGAKGESLRLESLDANNTPNPAPHVKHMLGWNRKALAITLLTNATPDQVSAAESLCALAAKKWVKS